MNWLEQHLEEFVKPVLQEHDCKNGWSSHDYPLREHFQPLGYFEQEELTVMKNAWRSIKRRADGQTILLPGRDVWLFEVLARRENYPTLFLPECSRQTVQHIAKTQPELAELFLFDTGFAGSIPRNMKSKNWKLLSADHGGYGNFAKATPQIFPRLTLSRHFALKIEDSPKYWESGRMVGNNYTYGSNWTVTTNWNVHGNVHGVAYSSNTNTVQQQVPADQVLQPFSDITEFIRAVRLTVEVYTNSSPKFINRHKPITTEGRKLW